MDLVGDDVEMNDEGDSQEMKSSSAPPSPWLATTSSGTPLPAAVDGGGIQLGSEPLFGNSASGTGVTGSNSGSTFFLGGGGGGDAGGDTGSSGALMRSSSSSGSAFPVASGSMQLLSAAGGAAAVPRCSFLEPEFLQEAFRVVGEAGLPVVMHLVKAAEEQLRKKEQQVRSARAEVEQAHVNVGQLLSDIQERRGPDFEKMYRELKREHDNVMLNCVKLSSEVERLRRTSTAISVLSGDDSALQGGEDTDGDGMSMMSGDDASAAANAEQELRPADVFNDIAALLDEMDRKMNFDKNAVGLEDLELLQEFLQALLEMQEQERIKAERAINSIRIDMERVQERCDLVAARQQAEQAQLEEQASRQAAAAKRNPFGSSLPPLDLSSSSSSTSQKRRGETQMSMGDLEDGESEMRFGSSSTSSASAAAASSASSSALVSPSKAAQEKRRQQLLMAKKRRVRENLQSLKDSFQRGGDGRHLEKLARTLRSYTHFTDAFPVATFRFGQSADDMEDASSSASSSSASVTDSSRHISAIRFDNEEEYFAICGRNGQLAIHSHQVSMMHGADPDALAPLQVLQNQSALTDLCWSPFAKGQLATSDASGSVVLWDAQTGSRVQAYRNHRGAAHAVHYSPQAQHLFASASQDCTVNIYHATQTEATAHIEMAQPVLSVRFNPLLENELCFGSADSNLYVFDIRNTKEAVHVLSQHRGPVNSLCLVGREEVLSQSYDGSVLYWSAGKAVREYTGHVHKHAVSLGLDSKGDFFATGSENNSVVVYSRELEHPMISHSFNSGFEGSDKLAYVSALCWKASSNVLVAGNSNGIVKV
eukprot:CAMPEP_0174242138 /NCGR_PEP_ID=MMETSP0417-20130205/26564_1 /TAXON_ID=242541 /ORGANISM="Mayorella sp, Strain BSH-02190019" /LENGTH=821 /DNA_ID=CAMNT_0015321497 /DNA_START=54 /DNA_END=2515 /DNA_ORIENTATION=-